MLRQALTSVAGQSYTDYEALVCDDASDEETEAVVREFDDRRVRHMRSTVNLGFMQNSIRGYVAARGDYVTTLHDDDTWEPDLLLRLVTPLVDHPAVVASFCDHWIIDADGRVDHAASNKTSAAYGRTGRQPGIVADRVQALLVDHAVPFILGTAVRRDAIRWDCVPPQTWRIFEMWLLYRLALSQGGLYYIPERLASYRQHGGSATAQSGAEWHESFAYLWRHLARDPLLSTHQEVFKQRTAEAEVLRTLQLLRERRSSEARRAGSSAMSEQLSVRSILVAGLAHLPGPVGRRAVGAWSSRGHR
jgi:glycosyltransferase involved in cell wall biosynthesis